MRANWTLAENAQWIYEIALFGPIGNHWKGQRCDGFLVLRTGSCGGTLGPKGSVFTLKCDLDHSPGVKMLITSRLGE
jgi:hypothetical protein